MTLRTGQPPTSEEEPDAAVVTTVPPARTDGAPAPVPPPPPRSRAARTRLATLRLLAPVLLTLLVGGVGLALLAHSVQLDHLHTRTDRRLQSSVAELTRIDRLAVDPRTGGAVTSLPELLDVYLGTLTLQQGEGLLLFAEGRPHATSLGRYPLEGLPDPGAEPWAALLDPTTPAQALHGSFTTPLGEAHFVALPVQHDGTPGVVVKTVLPARELAELREERTLLLLGVALLSLLGTVVVWVVVRPLRRTVREVVARLTADGTPLSGPPSAGGEAAELALAVSGVLDRAEATSAGQRRFLRLVSHELRDPLTVCQGHLELVGAGISDGPSTLPVVLDELGRMGRMVDDLQALGDADHQDFLLLTELEVGSFTEELLRKAAAMADRRWVLDAAGEGVVRADRHRLTEAVLNLVHNAVMHTEVGDTIAVGSSVDDARWCLWVRDTGVGADPSPELFLPAVRGPGSRRRYQGSGLGLAIVKLVAEAHGGSAQVRSAPGAGFTVTLELPTMVPDRSAGEHESDEP